MRLRRVFSAYSKRKESFWFWGAICTQRTWYLRCSLCGTIEIVESNRIEDHAKVHYKWFHAAEAYRITRITSR